MQLAVMMARSNPEEGDGGERTRRGVWARGVRVKLQPICRRPMRTEEGNKTTGDKQDDAFATGQSDGHKTSVREAATEPEAKKEGAEHKVQGKYTDLLGVLLPRRHISFHSARCSRLHLRGMSPASTSLWRCRRLAKGEMDARCVGLIYFLSFAAWAPAAPKNPLPAQFFQDSTRIPNEYIARQHAGHQSYKEEREELQRASAARCPVQPWTTHGTGHGNGCRPSAPNTHSTMLASAARKVCHH